MTDQKPPTQLPPKLPSAPKPLQTTPTQPMKSAAPQAPAAPSLPRPAAPPAAPMASKPAVPQQAQPPVAAKPAPTASTMSSPKTQLGSTPDKPPTSTIVQRPAGLPAAPMAPTATKTLLQMTPPGLASRPIAAAGAVPSALGATLPKAPSPAGTPPAGQLPPAPTPAEFKKSPLRFLPIVVLLLLVAGLGYFLYNRFFGSSSTGTTTTNTTKTGTTTTATKQTVITYWGLWEPTTVLKDTLADFEKANPTIKVNYQQQTYNDYRERLQTAIAGGKGPDVFRFHASWTPMLTAELTAVPDTVYTPAAFKSTFYPIAEQQLKINSKYVGVPLMYDGLALFYNKEALRTANAEVPKTWNELKALASTLTLRSNGKITRAGLAIGNASNVEHFGDILGLLILQNGGNPATPNTPETIAAVQYYTDFYTKDKVWDDQMASSTTAFARGDVAMMLAPSWRAHDIIAQNPNLSFEVAQVPQVGTKKMTWASYWAEGVSAQSKNKDAAWKLVKYLSSQEAMQKLHSDAGKERRFGEIYSRVDMAPSLATEAYVAPYLADAPFAQDWYMNTFTHDNGLNDQILKYYEDAVTAISANKGTPTSTMVTVDKGVKQVLRQYNLTQ